MIKAIVLSSSGFVMIFALGVTASINPGLFAVINRVPYADVILHFLLFGFLSTIVIVSVWPLGRRYVTTGILAAIIYAIADEMIQQLILTRTFSLLDLMADLIGIFLFSITSIYCCMKKDAVLSS